LPKNWNKVTHRYATGTACLTADSPAASKNVIPREWEITTRVKVDSLNGENVYLEGGVTGRDGTNFPSAAVVILATDPTLLKCVRLTDTLYVAIHQTANDDLEAYAISINGTTPTVGAVADVNTDDTDSADICRLSDTHFAVCYRDEGGSDYLCARIGSVDGTTITMGTENTLVASAVVECETAICQPRDGVIYVAFQNATTNPSSIAAAYSGTTIATAGTAVEIDTATNTPTTISCCRIEHGIVFVCWSDGGASTYARCATVSAAAAIGAYGTEKALNAIISTDLNARYVSEDKVIVGYIDAGDDPSAVVCTIAAGVVTTITIGAILEFLTGTATDMGIDMIDADHGLVKYDDGVYGVVLGFSISSVTITADSAFDYFVETTSAGGLKGGLACGSDSKCVIVYENSSTTASVIVGQYFENKIIDVRSDTVSAVYNFDLVPIWNKEATL